MTYDDWKQTLAGISLPAVLVDLDAFDRNIDYFLRAREAVGGRHTIRLATKSVRVPALIKRVLDRGLPFQGLMCYAAAEAAFLAREGFNDLLIAYPTHQESDLAILRDLHESGRTVRLIVDSLAGAEWIAQSMNGVSRPFELALDVDMSYRLARGRVHLGVRRSPIRTVEQVVTFFRGVAKLKNVRCRSLMGYEAQVAGLGDNNPFKKMMKPVVKVLRSRSAKQVADFRRSIVETLAKDGFQIELFNGGGSGSIDTTAAEPWLSEVTIGSGLLCSHLFSYYSNIAPEPACFFALSIARTSDEGYVTCSGGGYIASGEPGWEKVPVPFLPGGLKLVPMEGCGEVQTPLIVPSSSQLSPGDPVLFRHAKAGELAEHFNENYLVQNGQVVDVAPTYRGRGMCFLG